MPSRRKIIVGICLGTGFLAAVAVGAASWFWLPEQRAALDREASQIEGRVNTLTQHLNEWHQSPEGDMDEAVRALPTRTGLPGWAGELLAEMSASGAIDVHYTLGKSNHQENMASRALETHFQASVNDLGKIFDRITLWRPGVSVSGLQLAVGHQGRIDVTMDLTLLGSDDA